MNRDLVLYLEELLLEARAGRVQFFACAAAVSAPAITPLAGGALAGARSIGGLDVRAFHALGSDVARYDQVSLNVAYNATLRGLAETVQQLDATLKKAHPEPAAGSGS